MNQDLIEQYVSGRLGETEAQAFEEYCLAHPEFARQVEFEQRLRAGVAQVAQGSPAQFVPANHLRGWSVAASAALLLVLGGAFYAGYGPLSKSAAPLVGMVTTDSQRKGPSLRLAQVRGTDSVPALPRGLVRVEIVGLFEVDRHYSITLERLDPSTKSFTPLASLDDQRPTSPVTLELMVDSDRLKTGAYSLRIRTQTSSEESLDFGFVKP
jgi:hypothetical protein